ncbi:SDR family NAD(P)-dependent oxidoreductase [Micromonospora sp. WMMD1082]|uniref:SDR family NAD(P)-dependent oxidoreductase n=1 Tax=Micromonospora sp. WMMD1082 TaxID=3016104 RepID=UPI0024159CD5|nr:SDR family NAD(P)-dependent oxidoreductase [Micromonospora sp. WMMD1082]MDG4795429.1 SDR family NAD(P)-dependent oxidoreductase [Micromonospora sp. WMMD1082]
MNGAEVEAALRVLAEIRTLPVDDPVRQRVQRAVDGLLKDAQRQRRADRRRKTAAADRAVVAGAATGAEDRVEGVPVSVPRDVVDAAGAAGAGRTRRDRCCYACRDRFRTVDAFYHALCPACAQLHRRHRHAGTDLAGRRAVVTGGRVKIGFQVALKLLRDGAAVTVVTRFPADAARRYAREPDSPTWLTSLRVIGADLRDPRQVLDVAERLAADGLRLDILINNAAQTVRRPMWAYQPLIAAELQAAPEDVAVESAGGFRPGAAPDWSVRLPAAGKAFSQELASIIDATGALVVTGAENSWTAKVGQVDPVELLEVQLVNVVAPFLLLDRLRPALTAPGPGSRYVVNVTGREGWFSEDSNGPSRHPHTSVSKAALNMLTRVGATDLAQHHVYMCGVDTGWITDENPATIKARRAAVGWRPPLDVIDAAARIYHPIICGETGTPLYGVLLKNYAVVPW